MTEEIEPHIYKKYEIQQKLGKGAYGVVWKAVEKKSKKTVAIKKVFEAFYNPTDAQRTFREVMFLQQLNHENIIKILKVIKADNDRDLYLIFDFMETDLHAVIRAGILKDVHKQFIIYQILKSLKYMHSGELIHRDLKPSNVLINSECHIKLADFGLARSVNSYDDEGDLIMTEYVATRWYRAPEIILGSNKYSKAVDMWSVGCILGELIKGKAIFQGKSTLNQIELILELIGKPTDKDIECIGSDNAWNIINSISVKEKINITTHFRNVSLECLDFIKRCLEFNPKKRMTVEEALAHPYVADFRKKSEEIVLQAPIKISLNDNTRLSVKEYREAIYNDILKKNKEQRKKWQQKYLQSIGITHQKEQKIIKNTKEYIPTTTKTAVVKKNDSKIIKNSVKAGDPLKKDLIYNSKNVKQTDTTSNKYLNYANKIHKNKVATNTNKQPSSIYANYLNNYYNKYLADKKK